MDDSVIRSLKADRDGKKIEITFDNLGMTAKDFSPKVFGRSSSWGYFLLPSLPGQFLCWLMSNLPIDLIIPKAKPSLFLLLTNCVLVNLKSRLFYRAFQI